MSSPSNGCSTTLIYIENRLRSIASVDVNRLGHHSRRACDVHGCSDQDLIPIQEPCPSGIHYIRRKRRAIPLTTTAYRIDAVVFASVRPCQLCGPRNRGPRLVRRHGNAYCRLVLSACVLRRALGIASVRAERSERWIPIDNDRPRRVAIDAILVGVHVDPLSRIRIADDCGCMAMRDSEGTAACIVKQESCVDYGEGGSRLRDRLERSGGLARRVPLDSRWRQVSTNVGSSKLCVSGLWRLPTDHSGSARDHGPGSPARPWTGFPSA